jgi:hypothetical protein
MARLSSEAVPAVRKQQPSANKAPRPNLTATLVSLGFEGETKARTEMRNIALVTDDDLARSREDPEFRHRLVAENLELLLGQLNRLRNGKTDAQRAQQIREGVSLAVQLAEMLQRLEQRPASHTG